MINRLTFSQCENVIKPKLRSMKSSKCLVDQRTLQLPFTLRSPGVHTDRTSEWPKSERLYLLPSSLPDYALAARILTEERLQNNVKTAPTSMSGPSCSPLEEAQLSKLLKFSPCGPLMLEMEMLKNVGAMEIDKQRSIYIARLPFVIPSVV